MTIHAGSYWFGLAMGALLGWCLSYVKPTKDMKGYMYPDHDWDHKTCPKCETDFLIQHCCKCGSSFNTAKEE